MSVSGAGRTDDATGEIADEANAAAVIIDTSIAAAAAVAVAANRT